MKIIDDLYQYDLRMLLWCSRTQHAALHCRLAKSISRTGDGYLQLCLPLLILVLDQQQGDEFFSYAALAFALQMPLYWILKNCLQRQRPPEAIPTFESIIIAHDKFSFPSGHSAAAFLLANLTFIFYGSIAWPLFVWATLVAMSRVALGVHYPTDIIAGALLGSATAFVICY
ncbi:phosphatase PAP2 family protein [Oceanicoccus sp. KOV_DT_Chl]|uniref:phosphatase PAP2 family protein n=1 Tax=Oceanicoccus sp. KOV_DT_Chl TaxID=1904639 RepID=UPI001F286C5A|nr:phosphatase PAP2 family protein [Oceanicoccus sp. KOV_DT_Chl]